MLLDLHEQFFEDTEITNLKPKQTSFEKQKIIIFKIFGKIFQSKYNSGYRIRSQLLFEALINSIIGLQMISLTWYPDMKISDWDRYIAFWDIISYFNFNNFCGTFEATAYCFHGINTILSICGGLLLLMFVFSYTNLKIPRILVQILKHLLSALVTILYIPTLVEFSMIFKYSTFSFDRIYEYSGKKNSDLLNFGISGTIVISIYAILLVVLAYFWELFASDVRHAFWDKNLTVRAHSSVDIKMLIFKTLMSISYVLMRNVSIVIYQIIFMISSFLIFLEFIVKFPYYSKAENSIKSCKILAVSVSLLAILLGAAMDDAGVTFMLNFFLQPIIIVINCWLVNYRANFLKKSDINFTNQYDFERTIRHLLCNRHFEKKIQVINYFTACYINKALIKDKLMIIWEVNFCSFSMKDERLARIKLTKINSVVSTLEGSIQEWRALKNIDERDSSSIDAHYIEYLEDFNRAKRFDQEICYAFIDLWSEFSEKVPKYKKIYHHSIRSSDLLANLKEFYKKLVSKYKHPDLYDLYITFLENILGEIDEVGILNRMKGNLNHQVSFSTLYDTKLSSYEESNGIILISANENTFGTITYANDKAAELLKGSILDIVGTQLSLYIPSPYNYNHEEHLKKLYINYTSEEILKRGPFFLQNTLGYLVECGFMIKLTAFHNNAYFLATLTTRSTTRQLALITLEGLILNTTELFPHYIGATTHTIRNYCISDFIPNLDISQMRLFEPLIILIKDKKFALVRTIKELRTTTIHMLLLIHDEREIRIWKEGEDIDQIEYFKKINVNEEKKVDHEQPIKHLQHSITFRFQKFNSSCDHRNEESKEIEHHRLLNEFSKESCKNIDNTDEKSTSNMQGSSISSSSSSKNYSAIAQRCIESLSRNLIHFQWILLVCVIFIQMLAAIGTNIAVLVYIYQDTSHTNSLNVFSHFGNLIFHLANSADLARSIDSEKVSKVYNLTRDLGYFNDTINQLKQLRGYILTDYDDWNYCSSSSIIVDNVIPVWMFDPSPHIEKFNFYDEVGLFIKHGDNLIDMISQNKTYSNTEVKFFSLNSYGYTFEFTQNAMKTLVDCEVSRAEEIGKHITSWIFTGISILIIFMGTLAGYVVYMNRNFDKFWNFLIRISQTSYLDRRTNCIERLSKVHGIDYKLDSNLDYYRNKKFNRKVKSKIYIKYIWRLLIFLIVASSYYIILNFYLYDQCENFLVNRPKLLLSLISKRALLSRMSVFARDIASASSLRWMPNSYGLKTSKLEFQLSNEEFKLANSEIRNNNFLKLMTNSMKKKIFEAWDSEDYYLQQGIYVASNIMYIDANFISTSPAGTASVTQFGYYIGNETALQNAMGIDYEIIDRESKSVIQNELNLIIYVTIIFSSALLLLFLFFYLPFIQNEKFQLKKLKVLITIVPSTRTDSKSEKMI